MSANRADGAPGDHGARRVLWLIKGLGPGGAETLLTLSARAIDRSRWDPTVCYLLAHKNDLVADLEDAGVRTVCLDVRDVNDPRWLFRLRGLLKSQEFHVLHVHSPLVAAGSRTVVRSLARRRRPRLVSTEHNLWSSHKRITATLNALTFPLDDGHLAVSGAVRDSLPRRYRDRTVVVRHGVEIERIRRRAADSAAVRRELGIPDDVPVVSTVANLRSTKGYADLLEAARITVESMPTVRFLAVGQGPMREELVRLRDEKNLAENFRFLGYRDDAVAVVAASDVFCLASHHEGLPVAMMEALSVGVPIVATRVGGVPELVSDGKEADLVEPRDPRELAHALQRLLIDRQRRARMSVEALRTASDLDISDAVRKTEQIYDELVDV